MPNLNKDRANGSFIISQNKLFGFFGFCYKEDNYVNSIEYLDLEKMDKWEELIDIKFLKENILFNVESVATMYYKNDKNKILIYCGIQGEDEEFITEYYLLYDTINNSINKINKWEVNQYKNLGKIWKEYNLTEDDVTDLVDKKLDEMGYDEKQYKENKSVSVPLLLVIKDNEIKDYILQSTDESDYKKVLKKYDFIK